MDDPVHSKVSDSGVVKAKAKLKQSKINTEALTRNEEKKIRDCNYQFKISSSMSEAYIEKQLAKFENSRKSGYIICHLCRSYVFVSGARWLFLHEGINEDYYHEDGFTCNACDDGSSLYEYLRDEHGFANSGLPKERRLHKKGELKGKATIDIICNSCDQFCDYEVPEDSDGEDFYSKNVKDYRLRDGHTCQKCLKFDEDRLHLLQTNHGWTGASLPENTETVVHVICDNCKQLVTYDGDTEAIGEIDENWMSEFGFCCAPCKEADDDDENEGDKENR